MQFLQSASLIYTWKLPRFAFWVENINAPPSMSMHSTILGMGETRLLSLHLAFGRSQKT